MRKCSKGCPCILTSPEKPQETCDMCGAPMVASDHFVDGFGVTHTGFDGTNDAAHPLVLFLGHMHALKIAKETGDRARLLKPSLN